MKPVLLSTLLLCGCAATNPRVTVHRPEPAELHCPAENESAPWWRWTAARVHVYFACPDLTEHSFEVRP